jgi:hypothetical protein
MSPGEDFEARCRKAAVRFLQTVVVIDNEANMGEEPDAGPQTAQAARTGLSQARISGEPTESVTAGKQKQPAASPSGTGEQPEDQRSSTEAGHELNAKRVIDAFADHSVMCTVYKPRPDEEMVQRSTRIALNADLVVVDWHLQKGSSGKAKQIIAAILRVDKEHNGRLRLIAVYTAQPNLEELATELQSDLKASGSYLSRNSTTLQGPGMRIVFLEKANRGAGLPEQALPDKLIEEFAKMNSGLLPTTTLNSIAAIRENTHHLLSIFHSGLDASLILHRCLLPQPEDAEMFAVQLISDELGAILAAQDVASLSADVVASKEWAAARFIPVDALSVAGINAWIEAGKSVGDITKKTLMRNGQGKQYDRLATALYGSEIIAQERCREFSRISILKREAYGARSLAAGPSPVLRLGTIVRPVPAQKSGMLPGSLSSHIFLLCTQPACDSVRIGPAGRAFPFQRLSVSPDKFNVVVRLKDNSDVTLILVPAPHVTELLWFVPAPDVQQVVATQADGIHIFADDSGNRFEWIADMKELSAQSFASSLGASMNRVGTDQFEWLRQKLLKEKQD